MTQIHPGCWSFGVRGTDTDNQDRLHLFALFSYMQEAAYSHVRTLADAFGNFDKLGLCWLLIRISVRLQRSPRWGDVVTVETCHRGRRRLTYVRDFTFSDQDGHVFGQATSEWLVADRLQHRPQRPHPDWPREAVSDQVLTCPRLLPLDPQADILEPLLTKYADYSDIDRNNHVNNTRYVAWCIDTVQAARIRIDQNTLPLPAICAFDIHYLREVSLGERLDLYGSRDEQDPHSYQVEARLHPQGSTVFRARLQLADTTETS